MGYSSRWYVGAGIYRIKDCRAEAPLAPSNSHHPDSAPSEIDGEHLCTVRMGLQASDGAFYIAMRIYEGKAKGIFQPSSQRCSHTNLGWRDRGANRALRLHLLVNQSGEEQRTNSLFLYFLAFFLLV